MRLVGINDVVVGTRVGEPIYDNFGRLLLAHGVEITSTYLTQLRGMGLPALYIHDDDTSDIELPYPTRPAARPAPPIPDPATSGSELPSPTRPEARQSALQNLSKAFGNLAQCRDSIRESS